MKKPNPTKSITVQHTTTTARAASGRKRRPAALTPYVAPGAASPPPSVTQIPTATVAAPPSPTSVTGLPTAVLSPITSPGSTPTTTAASPSPAATTTVSNVVAAPPAVTLPTPPDGFIAPNMADFRGFHPTKTELAAAMGTVSDLGKFADYLTVLGTAAPDAVATANAVSVAMRWRMMRGPTETWDAYVRAQDAMAWKVAITLLDELKPLFLIAAAKNSTLATTYPGLAQMFNAAKATARTATATKKKNAKAAASAAASAAATAEAVKAATAPAAPPKAVTVNA